MGCGSSRVPQAEDTRKAALAAHLYSILGITPVSEIVETYVIQLKSEGWDTPDDFDELPVDELCQEPFNFRPGHLKKVRISL